MLFKASLLHAAASLFCHQRRERSPEPLLVTVLPKCSSGNATAGFSWEARQHTTHTHTGRVDGIEPPSEKVASFSSLNIHTLTLHATFNFNLVNRSACCRKPSAISALTVVFCFAERAAHHFSGRLQSNASKKKIIKEQRRRRGRI